ncbi:MAG: YqaA family protein [Pseudomonadales bacterium]
MIDLAYVGLFGSSFVSSTLLPGGSEVALLYLVQQAQYDTGWLFLAALSGNVLGALLTFALGWLIARKYSAKSLEKRWQRKALSWLQRHGVWALLLSWLPLIGDPLCLMAGWLRLNPMLSALLITAGKALRYGFIIAVAS